MNSPEFSSIKDEKENNNYEIDAEGKPSEAVIDTENLITEAKAVTTKNKIKKDGIGDHLNTINLQVKKEEEACLNTFSLYNIEEDEDENDTNEDIIEELPVHETFKTKLERVKRYKNINFTK